VDQDVSTAEERGGEYFERVNSHYLKNRIKVRQRDVKELVITWTLLPQRDGDREADPED